MRIIKEIKNEFKPFIRFKNLETDQFESVEVLDNNLLYLKKNLSENINESGVENLGTDFMLYQMGQGNLKFSRRWAWLFRHYIWASRVIVPRANVVDVGCDVGEIRKIISKSFYIKNPLYLGIDLNYKGLKEGAEKIQMKIPAIYVQHDVTLGLHFIKSNSVDIIFAGEIIEHFKKKFGIILLKEMKRVLKEGGRFIISTPNKNHSKGYDFHVHEYEIEEIKELIEKIGLKVDKIWGWVTTEKLVLSSKKKNVKKCIIS